MTTNSRDLSASPPREGEEKPVVTPTLRTHLDAAFAAVGDFRHRYQWASVPCRLADDALHHIKEAMLLAYPDSDPREGREALHKRLCKIALRYRMDHTPECAKEMHGEDYTYDSRCATCREIDEVAAALAASPASAPAAQTEPKP